MREEKEKENEGKGDVSLFLTWLRNTPDPKPMELYSLKTILAIKTIPLLFIPPPLPFIRLIFSSFIIKSQVDLIE